MAFQGAATKTSWEPMRYFRWRQFQDYSSGIIGQLFFPKLTELTLALNGVDPEKPRRASTFGGLVNDVGVVEAIRGHEGTLFFEKGGMVPPPQELPGLDAHAERPHLPAVPRHAGPDGDPHGHPVLLYGPDRHQSLRQGGTPDGSLPPCRTSRHRSIVT